MVDAFFEKSTEKSPSQEILTLAIEDHNHSLAIALYPSYFRLMIFNVVCSHFTFHCKEGYINTPDHDYVKVLFDINIIKST